MVALSGLVALPVAGVQLECGQHRLGGGVAVNAPDVSALGIVIEHLGGSRR